MKKPGKRRVDPGIRVPAWQDALGAWIERQPALWRSLGNWESRLLRERLTDIRIDRPIYICGLARSGTTILLTLLAEHASTATHRYRDFPALFTPWAWDWFLARAASSSEPTHERAHGDGLMVSADSPEAFEEVIWSAFWHTEASLAGGVLDRSHHRPEFEAFYTDHLRKLLLLRSGSRYLAKGNYNLTRLRYLNRLFPNARFIILVREPLWHIASLMRQHQRFCASHAADARGRRYMRRAGHFEFGLDRRPIDTGDPRVANVLYLWRSGRELDGWALYWTLIHDYLAQTLAEDEGVRSASLVVRYEDFCANPAQLLTKILDHCELSHQGLPQQAPGAVHHPSYYSPPFSASERATIARVTGRTALHFGYLQERPAESASATGPTAITSSPGSSISAW